jgi:hypothetical protein
MSISPPTKPHGYSEIRVTDPYVLSDSETVWDSDNGDNVRTVVPVVTVTKGEPEWGSLAVSDTRIPLDLERLPKQVARFVSAVSESLQVPYDLVFLLMLGVMSAATRGRFRVQVKPKDPGHVESCAIYAAVFMDPGERKTPTLKLVKSPLVEAEKLLIQDSRIAIKESVETEQRLSDRVKFTRSKCVKAPDNVELQAEYDEAQSELHKFVPVIPPRLVVGDITPERLAAIMSEQRGSVALISDEGGTLKNLAGRYSESGGNLDVVNQGFSGGSVYVDRQGREPVVIEHAHLAIVLAVQPDVAREIKGNTEMKDRGFLDRFIVAQPLSSVGNRTLETEPVPAQVSAQWQDCISALVSQSTELLAQGELHTLTVTPDSFDLYRNWWNNTEPRLGELGDLTRYKGWVSKCEGILPRIAALFALIENSRATQVQAMHMESALSLWEYLLGQVQYVFGDPVTGSTAKVLAAIKDLGTPEITLREIYRKTKTQPEQVRADLALLESLGYVRRMPKEGTRTDKWQVHPLLRSSGAGLMPHRGALDESLT